jgi:2-dehydro-3-deoxy-D-arabinonate dehydratase
MARAFLHSRPDADPPVWDRVFRDPEFRASLLRDGNAQPSHDDERPLPPPIGSQEVWAAGVTYFRSRDARMEESAESGGGDFYARVYDAERPELFFKATPHRVRGHRQPVRVRRDARWNVPEPELVLAICPRGQIIGYTIGNDMSSRDIEGENPLYLPQAKVYDACCGVGPVITLSHAMPPRDEIGIRLAVNRGSGVIFEGSTCVAQMARGFDELIGWLGRNNSFPAGVLLMTGTGIVPPREFSLQPADRIEITIDGIGTLSNSVIQLGATG